MKLDEKKDPTKSGYAWWFWIKFGMLLYLIIEAGANQIKGVDITNFNALAILLIVLSFQEDMIKGRI